jgi:hypothetical protein
VFHTSASFALGWRYNATIFFGIAKSAQSGVYAASAYFSKKEIKNRFLPMLRSC